MNLGIESDQQQKGWLDILNMACCKFCGPCYHPNYISSWAGEISHWGIQSESSASLNLLSCCPPSDRSSGDESGRSLLHICCSSPASSFVCSLQPPQKYLSETAEAGVCRGFYFSLFEPLYFFSAEKLIKKNIWRAFFIKLSLNSCLLLSSSYAHLKGP